MTQGGPRQFPGPRIASIPAFARPSAEHVRALEAAGLLKLRLFKKVAQRPLMSVWEGENATGQRVLLTVVDACSTPPERARIIRAAQALMPLAGTEGIQHVHRVLEDVSAFVADFLGAGSAADLVVLRWQAPRRLAFVCRVCEALVALHDSGLVHGCLCPDNILLNDDLQPVLTEVGMVSIAASLDRDPENLFGYGAYASAEAARGTPDTGSDIYSIGRLLSFVLLDRTPQDDDLVELDAKFPDVAPVVRHCLAPPEERYPSMADLLAELQHCRQRLAPAGGEIAPRPPEPPVAPPPPPVAAPGAWAPAKPATKTGAPPWVAVVSAVALLASVVVGRILLVGSGTIHIVLESAVALAAVGVTAAIRTTIPVRVVLTLGALGLAFAADPVGRLSRLDANDAGARGDAARTFVRKGGKDLRGKRLQAADFSGLDLAGAELRGADLTSANFAGAKLKDAHVEGASFILANLTGADLSGVALGGAFGVETAVCDATTVLPTDWYCNADGKLRPGSPPP